MEVALFVPCYVDQFFPETAKATLRLLENLGCTVCYPTGQTCCGQPLANAGYESEAGKVYKNFVETFQAFEYVVSPSASCVYHFRKHFYGADKEIRQLQSSTFELSEFLTEVLQKEDVIGSNLQAKVAIHQGCHGLRGLNLGAATEQSNGATSNLEKLLAEAGLELVKLENPDECCGFGGMFSIGEAAVSVKMGIDRLSAFQNAGAEIITSTDMSCLMHIDGILRRRKMKMKVMHFSELLNPVL